ncbi:prepilin-type N-terminal cleavage/methylation domain-containing protein [Neptuniibacter sp. PT8_73]|uniref:prepilin-type N-terminal cleavage/methylation domain-containing protein n=1 Tax=unclassified Neptuniibacter TaxID=2630693 RepID=UPI0039F6C13F
MKNVVNKQHGFTLLELVVVVAVMGLIASLATEFVVQDSNQERYNSTRTKVKSIRDAIVGQPNLSSNGEVQVSGFIADTGRLPNSLLELLMGEYCPDPQKLHDQAACGASWEVIEGWKGPYLVDYHLVEGAFDQGTSTTSDDVEVQYPVYRDAWGNTSQAWSEATDSSDTKLEEDIRNSGWRFNVDSGDISVISAGLDNMRNPASYSSTITANASQQSAYANQIDFEKDYPNAIYVGTSAPYTMVESVLVHKYMYESALSNITVNLNVQNTGTAPSVELCARSTRNGNSSDTTSSSFSTTISGSGTLSVDFPAAMHGSYVVDVFSPGANCNDPIELTDSEKLSNIQVVLASRSSVSPLEFNYVIEVNP